MHSVWPSFEFMERKESIVIVRGRRTVTRESAQRAHARCGIRYSIRRSHHGFKVRSGVMATGRVDMVGLSFRYERSEVRNGGVRTEVPFSAQSVCVRSDNTSLMVLTLDVKT